jgi:hypothetical protein
MPRPGAAVLHARVALPVVGASIVVRAGGTGDRLVVGGHRPPRLVAARPVRRAAAVPALLEQLVALDAENPPGRGRCSRRARRWRRTAAHGVAGGRETRAPPIARETAGEPGGLGCRVPVDLGEAEDLDPPRGARSCLAWAVWGGERPEDPERRVAGEKESMR